LAVVGWRGRAGDSCRADSLAVEQPGALQASEDFALRAEPRALSITEAIHAKWARHRH
jgi:hypothetical protein